MSWPSQISSPRSPTTAGVEHAFVGVAVAIIVVAVADFIWHITATTTGISHALIDAVVAVIVDAITYILGYLTAATTRIRDAFIDSTITAVVSAITHFVCGMFVGLTIAVIVEFITNLGDDGVIGSTGVDKASVLTDTLSIGDTFTDATLGRDGGDALVGAVVAVVVAAIADLSLWHARTDALTGFPAPTFSAVGVIATAVGARNYWPDLEWPALPEIDRIVVAVAPFAQRPMDAMLASAHRYQPTEQTHHCPRRCRPHRLHSSQHQ